MNETTAKKKVHNGYVLLFAVALEIAALIFGGFVVALFGLFAFMLGIAWVVLGMTDDPDGVIASLKNIKRMDDDAAKGES